MAERDDLIWIEDAAKAYGVSRRYLEGLVGSGDLLTAEWPGDRKTYLLKPQLEKFFQVRIKLPPGAAVPGDDSGAQQVG